MQWQLFRMSCEAYTLHNQMCHKDIHNQLSYQNDMILDVVLNEHTRAQGCSARQTKTYTVTISWIICIRSSALRGSDWGRMVQGCVTLCQSGYSLKWEQMQGGRHSRWPRRLSSPGLTDTFSAEWGWRKGQLHLPEAALGWRQGQLSCKSNTSNGKSCMNVSTVLHRGGERSLKHWLFLN